MTPVPVTARFRSSDPDNSVQHVVRQAKSGELFCTCPGFAFRGRCQHVEAVSRWQALGQTIDPTELHEPPVKWTREQAP